MAQTFFDLFWVYPDPTPEQWQVPMALERRDGNAHGTVDSAQRGIPGAILYPATLTPAVFVEHADEMVELILLFKKNMDLNDEKLRQRINCQLKVGFGLNPKKSYNPNPLFVDGDLSKLITIDNNRDLDGKPLRTGKDAKGRFRCVIERHVIQLYQAHDFTKLYCVSIHPGMFDSVLRDPLSKQANLEKEGWTLFRDEGRDDNQDYIISHELKNPKFDPKAKDKEIVHGFVVTEGGVGQDVHVGEIDQTLPVQTYHPVVVFDNLAYANLGHFSDIHVGSRQQALRRSKAKVIEHPDIAASIGDCTNVYSARVHELLIGLGNDDAIDLVVLGGDLMDHLPNAYCQDLYSKGWSSNQEIWDFVGLDKNWAQKYVNNVDFLSLYSLIVHFYTSHPKPIFVVTGNHDYYAYPYGISPRKFAKEAGKRANEGIPADHNLTIYEAIVLFGPNYDAVFPSTSSPFTGDQGKWFFYFFTPFSDYGIELPKQFLVALAWGEDETVVEDEGQGFGHLPRSTLGFTKDQIDLLNEVVKDRAQKKVILTTHFTFVSYEEDLPNTHTGTVKMIDSGTRTFQDKFTRRDMGTFEHMRRRLYKELIWDQKAIQLVLTGHSHRRGLYRFTGFNTAKSQNDETLGTRHYDVRYCGHGSIGDLPDLAENPPPPLVVLSDSGGPVPRLNYEGEFCGWGSDLPGGTRILFNPDSGEILFVHVQETTLRPRFVVALDYMDIISVEKKKCSKVIASFSTKTDVVDGKEKERDTLWTFRLQFNLNAGFKTIGYTLPVSKVELYFTDQLDSPQDQVRDKITLSGPRDSGVDATSGPWSEWMVPRGGDRDRFESRFLGKRDRTTFAAIYFEEPGGIPQLARYDFSTPWAFEINISAEFPSRSAKPPQKLYSITRVNPEFPDLDSRGEWLGYKKPG